MLKRNSGNSVPVGKKIEVKWGDAMGSTQELLSRIRELEIENMELKSKLDQYQSIFTGPQGGSGSQAAATQPAQPAADPVRARRTNRGVGISAEPQSLKSLQDLTNQTFPEFKKQDR